MSTVVICGGPHAPLHEFEARLRTIGVAAPLEPPTGQLRTMPDWLARLFASRLPVPVDAPAVAAPAPRRLLSRLLGRPARADASPFPRVWELAANEIYLANAGVACWGWADVRNSHVLDFLEALDRDTRYVMLVQSPAQALAAVQAQCDSPIDVDAVLGVWQHAAMPMLQFCSQHRQRVFLTDVEHWQSAPDSAAAALAHWLGLSAPDDVAPLPAPDPVLQWLMRHGTVDRPEARDPWNAVRELLPAATERDIDVATVSVAWIEGRREVGAATAARDEEAQHAEALATERSALAEALAATTLAADASLRESADRAEENAQLVAQLHLAQEALERHLHNLGDREREIVTLGRKLAAAAGTDAASSRKAKEVAAERDAEKKRADIVAKAKAEIEAQLALATAGVAAAERARQETAEENESLLQALHHAQEELEMHCRKLKHAEAEGAELAKEVAAAVAAEGAAALKAGRIAAERDAEKKRAETIDAEREAQTQRADTATAERDSEKKRADTTAAERDSETKRADTLAAQNAGLAAKLARATEATGAAERNARDQAEESASLLQELHRAQEALESHLRRLADKEGEAQRLATRLAGFRKSYPGHVEWDEAIASDEGDGAVRVVFRGLAIAGASLRELALVATWSGTAAMLSVDAGQPAAPWSGAPGETPLVLDGHADPRGTAFGRMAALSTTAWAICGALPEAVRRALLEHGRLDAAGATALTTLQAQLAAPKAVWRTDSVSLFDEQVDAERERLCLHLCNASFAGRTWPRFEFRIGAANLRRGKFATVPTYEFPLQSPGPHQFESWRETSADDDGPTFEIRFDTKAGGIDAGVWKSLGRNDQSQLIALMLQLPRWLNDVAAAGARISREWSDWAALNNHALEIVHALLSGNGSGSTVQTLRLDRPAVSSSPASVTALRTARGNAVSRRKGNANGKQIDPA